jgi:hypothetical protein
VEDGRPKGGKETDSRSSQTGRTSQGLRGRHDGQRQPDGQRRPVLERSRIDEAALRTSRDEQAGPSQGRPNNRDEQTAAASGQNGAGDPQRGGGSIRGGCQHPTELGQAQDEQQEDERRSDGRGGDDRAPCKTLTILYCNAQSVVGKINDLSATAAEQEPDLILITESWCNQYIDNAFLSLPGYELQQDLRLDHADTADGRGVGAPGLHQTRFEDF